ncbi:MAG: hypothetical protein SWX82_31350 [Cyanobacteriota bacterium]|nr:hypothetical protein [Cyanobacteriota bacterium]
MALANAIRPYRWWFKSQSESHNISLKHNYVFTFYTNTQDDNIEVPEYYRMVFYNRFFDPMA